MNKKNRMARNLMVFTTVMIVLLIAIYFLTKATHPSGNVAFEKAPSIDGQPVLGSLEAPVTVVEFGDYKCPACKYWHETVFPQLKKDFIDTGKVKFAFVNILFHGEESRLASLAAESVYAQDKEAFWKFHDGLYAAQPPSSSSQAWVNMELLLNTAKQHAPGINIKSLEEEIQNKTRMSSLEEDGRLADDYRIRETPSIMVNHILLEDPFAYDQLAAIIRGELGE